MMHTTTLSNSLDATAIVREKPMAGREQSMRLPVLDFIKGALVLIMVLYHWWNYFISPLGSVYKYLRFLTPSFIFISGFLVSHVYLARPAIDHVKIAKRLTQRGLKILGVFVALNLVRTFLIPDVRSGIMPSQAWSLRNLMAIYLTGNVSAIGTGKAAAFYILVPISYLLLVSAGLVLATKKYKNIFKIAGPLLLLAVFVLDFLGLQYGNLELLAIGLLGVTAGYLSLGTIESLLTHRVLILLGYLSYTVVITVWNVTYPVQIVGVCLNLMLIYVLGMSSAGEGRIGGIVILLGKYSLFGYIAQIAILQGLYRGLRSVKLGAAVLPVSFCAAFALTVITVELLNRARGKVVLLDRVYRAVFA